MCQMGMLDQCLEKTSSESNPPSQVIESVPFPTGDEDDNEEVRGSRGGRSNSRRAKRDSQLKDQQSTGRKRAAKKYPLHPDSACEWQGMANCGGGAFPILGCLSGKQEARHHGPDKSTSNNELGNVHRICHYCHNRWHVLNDPGYDWNNPNATPHKPCAFTAQQTEVVLLDEMRYKASKKPRKVVD